MFCQSGRKIKTLNEQAYSMTGWTEINPVWILAGLALIGAIGSCIWRVSAWHANVNSDRENFKEFMERVEGKIDTLIGNIGRLIDWQGGPALERGSPLKLSEVGQKILDALDIPAMAKELAPKVKPKVEGKVPYDIQEFCFTYIRDEYDLPPEAEKRIKEYVYGSGHCQTN